MYFLSLFNVLLKVVYVEGVGWLDSFSDKWQCLAVCFNEFSLPFQNLHHLK